MCDTPSRDRRRILRDIARRVSQMELNEAELRMVLSWAICEGPTAVTSALDRLERFRVENGQAGISGHVIPFRQQTTTPEEMTK